MIYFFFLCACGVLALTVGIFFLMVVYCHRHEGSHDGNAGLTVLGLLAIAGCVGCLIGAGTIASNLDKIGVEFGS